MAMPPNEPKSAEAVQRWVEKTTQKHDRFAHVAKRYDGHRASHGCYDVYPYPNGALLGTLAAAHRANRIIEVGGGLGYSALWFAYGAGPGSRVESVECDADHAALARAHFNAESLSERIIILHGTGATVLPTLKVGYDLAYFDTDPAESLIDLENFAKLLKPGGLLISANLFLGQYAPDLPGLDKTAAYRERILDGARWLTSFLPDGTAVSIKR
ncbi:MAG TPA: class I SAM-dependent methyltransferase [Acidobacteriota bacterium]|nr:class I SAM-dependent methyltransferase [Acidobacteriota bacterium]